MYGTASALSHTFFMDEGNQAPAFVVRSRSAVSPLTLTCACQSCGLARVHRPPGIWTAPLLPGARRFAREEALGEGGYESDFDKCPIVAFIAAKFVIESSNTSPPPGKKPRPRHDVTQNMSADIGVPPCRTCRGCDRFSGDNLPSRCAGRRHDLLSQIPPGRLRWRTDRAVPIWRL
jgi:hypothetical protein